MLSMVLSQVGLPLEGIGMILAVDRIVDMGRTTVNITGDLVCSVIIDRIEKRAENAEEKVQGKVAPQKFRIKRLITLQKYDINKLSKRTQD